MVCCRWLVSRILIWSAVLAGLFCGDSAVVISMKAKRTDCLQRSVSRCVRIDISTLTMLQQWALTNFIFLFNIISTTIHSKRRVHSSRLYNIEHRQHEAVLKTKTIFTSASREQAVQTTVCFLHHATRALGRRNRLSFFHRLCALQQEDLHIFKKKRQWC